MRNIITPDNPDWEWMEFFVNPMELVGHGSWNLYVVSPLADRGITCVTSRSRDPLVIIGIAQLSPLSSIRFQKVVARLRPNRHIQLIGSRVITNTKGRT